LTYFYVLLTRLNTNQSMLPHEYRISF